MPDPMSRGAAMAPTPAPDLDRATIRFQVARRGARDPIEIDGHPAVEQALPGGPAARPKAHRRVARREQSRDRRTREAEPRALAGGAGLVDDRVGQTADSMDDGWRAVAERDHLALAAWLEAGWHREEVGAGVDLAGHHPIESFDEGHPVRVGQGDLTERVGQLWVTAPLDDQPGATLEQRRCRPEEQVEPLLRIQPSDHPDDGTVVGRIEPEAGQQVRPAHGLACA